MKYGSSMLATDVRDSYDADAPRVAADRREPRALRAAVGPLRRAQRHGRALHAGRRQRHRDPCRATTSRSRTARAATPSSGWAPRRSRSSSRAGMRVGLGTDSPAASNSMDVFEEMRIGLLVQRATLGEHHFMNAGSSSRWRRSTPRARWASTIGSARSSPASRPTSSPSTSPSRTRFRRTTPTARSSTPPTRRTSWRRWSAGEIVYEGREWRNVDHERVFSRAEEMRMKLRA